MSATYQCEVFIKGVPQSLELDKESIEVLLTCSVVELITIGFPDGSYCYINSTGWTSSRGETIPCPIED